MNILLNGDKSINCISDSPFTVEHHSGLTLVEVPGKASDRFPNGSIDWRDLLFDQGSSSFLTAEEYADLGKTTEHISAAILQNKVDKIKETLQTYLDAPAKAKGYDSIHTASLRAALPNSPFHAEGVAFGEWMDACNAKCYELLVKFESGEIPEMTPEEVIAQLPELVLP